MAQRKIDLTTLSGWDSLTYGSHTITLKAKGTGNYTDSDISAGVNITKPAPVYTITPALTNVVADASNPTTITYGTTATLTYTADSGYTLPNSVSVTGATLVSWTNGVLTISNPTGNVSFSIAGQVISYAITTNLTHTDASPSNPTTMTVEDTAKILSFTAQTGYVLPSSITVTGATQSWNQTVGALTLTQCTGPISITINSPTAVYTITPTLTNVTPSPANPSTIAYGAEEVTLTFSITSDYQYPETVTVVGATSSWIINGLTGVLVLSYPTSNVTFTIAATLIPQLDAPTNESIDGTNYTLTPPEGATSVEIYAGDILLGEVSLND